MTLWKQGVAAIAGTALITVILRRHVVWEWIQSIYGTLQGHRLARPSGDGRTNGSLNRSGKNLDDACADPLIDIEDSVGPSVCSKPLGRHSGRGMHSAPAHDSIYGQAGVRMIHLEVTDKCNAACPQCARNRNGGATNPLLPLVELSATDVEEMLPTEDLASIRKIYLCGNYGDPCSARDCLQILKYLRGANEAVGLHTNGGARTAQWWSEAGKLLQGRSYARFAIDGLEDTNHLYRQNVSWKALMRNVRAFVAAGGNAQWDYLVFRHNQHQVEEARALSKELGFTAFQIKKTQRFLNWRTGELRDSTPVENSAGEVVRHLQLPSETAFVNSAIARDILQRVERFGSIDAYYGACAVDCKAARDKEAYISAEGFVFPCCWLAGHLYNDVKASDREALALLERAGLSLQDLRLRPGNSLRDITSNPLFADALPASFKEPSLAAGKLRTCAKACGKEANAYARQFQ